MWSEVEYDPDLDDPFFHTSEWSYPHWIIVGKNGFIENIAGGTTKEEELPKLQHTANCFSNSFYLGPTGPAHLVRFCEVRLLDAGVMELLIHDKTVSSNDNLIITIRNGMFSSQYWSNHARNLRDIVWKTSRQKLILEKMKYSIGDAIKGYVFTECMQIMDGSKYPNNPLQLMGVFKAIVK
jgi:hypothetical protein